jgi:hypothetical protein
MAGARALERCSSGILARYVREPEDPSSGDAEAVWSEHPGPSDAFGGPRHPNDCVSAGRPHKVWPSASPIRKGAVLKGELLFLGGVSAYMPWWRRRPRDEMAKVGQPLQYQLPTVGK